jgi:hypothetical protein
VLQIPAGKMNLFLLQIAETKTVAHPNYYSFGIGSSFPERKAAVT